MRGFSFDGDALFASQTKLLRTPILMRIKTYRRKRTLRIESLERRALFAALTMADTTHGDEVENSPPAWVGTFSVPAGHAASTEAHQEHHGLPSDSGLLPAADHHAPHLPNFAMLSPVGSGRVWASHSNGAWSDLFGDAGSEDIVRIRDHVIFDSIADVHTVVIEAGGRLEFATDADLSLRVVNFQVLSGGELVIGTTESPITGHVEIVFKDVAIDPHRDPGQYGNGLIVQGMVRMHGRTLEETFVRLEEEARAGHQQLQLGGDLSGWNVGDTVLLPDTRQLFYTDHTSSKLKQYEQVAVAAVGPTGLELDSPLLFDHLGARDADGQLKFAPHVANLSRNIVFRSENPGGTRGHSMYIGRADIDIRYVSFQDMGRTTNRPADNTVFDASGHATHFGTNAIGRYPVHLHHLIGPEGGQPSGYQATVVGNSVHTTENPNQHHWGIVIHATHYAKVADNVVYNYAGSGIVTENGTESFNMISGNFISRIDGTRERAKFSDGREGTGIWLRRPNNFVVDNVVSGAESAAFAVYGGNNAVAPDVRIPAFQGADPSGADHVLVSPESMHLFQFERNEAYASHVGLELWYLGFHTYYQPTSQPLATSVVNDLHLWHINHTGIFGEQAHNMDFNDVVIVGDPKQLTPYNIPRGIELVRAVDVTINNPSIDNKRIGIETPTRVAALGSSRPIHEIRPFLINGGMLRNDNNILVRTPSEDAAGNAPPRYTVIRDVRFSTDPKDPGSASNITMAYRDGRFTNVVQQDVVEVEGFHGHEGADFRLFYKEQRPDFVVPRTGSKPEAGHNSPIGAPISGLTNTEAWDQYRVAVGGAVAPGDASSETRLEFPGVSGLAFPLLDHLVPPVITGITPDSGTAGDFITYHDRVMLQGVARPSSTVTVLRDGIEVGTAQADERGNWQLDQRHLPLHPGVSEFAAVSHWGGAATALSQSRSVMLLNQAPVVRADHWTVVENAAIGDVIGTVTAHDPDRGDRLQLTITAGNSNGLFRLNSQTGELSIARDFGYGVFRGTYALQVRAIDRAGLATDQMIQVTVLPRVPGEWVQDLRHQDFPTLSPEEIVFLTPEQLATIPDRESLFKIPTASRAALTGEQVRGLNLARPGMIDALTAEQILELSPGQIASLGGTGTYAYLDYARLPASQIIALTPSQIGSIPDKAGFMRIPDASRAALSAEQVQALRVSSIGMIDGLTSEQILHLTDDQIRSMRATAFGYLDFARLPPSRIVALTPLQIGAIPDAAGFMRISAASRAALTVAQVQALRLNSFGMIGGLTPEQVLHLTDSQIASMRVTAFGYLDLARIPPSRITALTTEQLSLLSSREAFMTISAASRLRLAELGAHWVEGQGVVWQ